MWTNIPHWLLPFFVSRLFSTSNSSGDDWLPNGQVRCPGTDNTDMFGNDWRAARCACRSPTNDVSVTSQTLDQRRRHVTGVLLSSCKQRRVLLGLLFPVRLRLPLLFPLSGPLGIIPSRPCRIRTIRDHLPSSSPAHLALQSSLSFTTGFSLHGSFFRIKSNRGLLYWWARCVDSSTWCIFAAQKNSFADQLSFFI